jgi:NADH:quinone reductase (non-electrogenic)
MTDLRLGRVERANPEHNCLHVVTQEGHQEELDYDQLIVALGSVSRTLPVPGLAEHGMGFKTISEAIALRNRIIGCLEMAESLDDAARREEYLSFVFVGAGYAGLEGLAELQDFAADIVDNYPRCRVQGLRFTLVEARDRVMPEIQADLAEFAVRELRGRGIEIQTGTTVDEITARSVRLSTGEMVPARTVVWTAGVKPHPVVQRLGLPLGANGRIEVDRTMRVQEFPNVWAIGDSANVPDPARKGEPSPPTAQHAIRQGRRVARNVAAEIGNGRVQPFRYRTLGVFVDMGRFQAVASTLGIKWRGFPAWFLARTYHLAWMPGVKRKMRLVIDWTVALLFSRDSAELGQLGHPPHLGEEEPPLMEHSSGGTGAEATGGDGAAGAPARADQTEHAERP